MWHGERRGKNGAALTARKTQKARGVFSHGGAPTDEEEHVSRVKVRKDARCVGALDLDRGPCDRRKCGQDTSWQVSKAGDHDQGSPSLFSPR
ncbi:hypothetical protein KM043_015434 [Ampulex compressa]|nr:hypothetical protein KM043_015434 [Ampulex compressa]